MDERQAKLVAEALGGRVWQSGGGLWMVLLTRSDGKVVAITDESVCLYESEDALVSSAQAEESLVLV